MENNVISAKLIYRKIEERLSASEEKRFDAWLNESDEHRDYFEKMKEMYLEGEKQIISVEEVKVAWDIFDRRVKKNQHVKSNKRWVWGMSIAASLLILFGFSVVFYLYETSRSEIDPVAEVIVPGQNNATLEMADGTVYQLGGQHYSLQEKTGNKIMIDSAGLSYLPSKDAALPVGALVYNKLSIPKGGEYKIELEDGTKVWINSASRLQYPVVFTEKTREVYLDGEAYFEVRRDTARPFIVHSGSQKVTVLGTSFGITCYPNEVNDYTTLVSGKVKVEFGETNRSYVLVPGMQVAYNKQSGEITERKVDVSEFVAWKDGKYIFRQKRLEDILSTLSRWYDFEVFYQNADVKEVMFSGELKRFDDFNYLLRLIERTSDVKFIIDKKIVRVTR